jgi:hypothetical protein
VKADARLGEQSNKPADEIQQATGIILAFQSAMKKVVAPRRSVTHRERDELFHHPITLSRGTS